MSEESNSGPPPGVPQVVFGITPQQLASIVAGNRRALGLPPQTGTEGGPVTAPDRPGTPDGACVFCGRIERGEYDYDDAHNVAFEPLNPVTPGHLLVVPRKHFSNAFADPRGAGEALTFAGYLANKLDIGAANFITSAGHDATQTVFHLHVHIVPRFAGDGLALPWTAQQAAIAAAAPAQPFSRAELETAMAGAIQQLIDEDAAAPAPAGEGVLLSDYLRERGRPDVAGMIERAEQAQAAPELAIRLLREELDLARAETAAIRAAAANTARELAEVTAERDGYRAALAQVASMAEARGAARSVSNIAKVARQALEGK